MDELVESPLIDYLYRKADRQGIPLSGTFELTPECNMNCKMCYVRLNKAEIEKRGYLRTTEEWIDLAWQAKEKGMLFLLLTGGEPFLRRDFKTIYEEIRQMGIAISINSNGTLLDEKMVDWLSVRKPARMNITLYGVSNETYGRLCQNEKGFTQVTNALNMLKEAEIPVKLNCSLTPFNAHENEAIHRFADEHGYVIQTATYMFPPIRKDENLIGQNRRFTAEETAKVTIDLEMMKNGKEIFCQHIEEIKTGAEDILNKDMYQCEGDRMQCKAGTCSFWVTWDGKMLPCGLMPLPVTYPFKDGFEIAWNQLKEKVKPIRLPRECAICINKEKCHTCAAMVYAETGSFTKKPEYRCDIMDSYLEISERMIRGGDLK